MTKFEDTLKILKLNDPKLGKIIDLIKPEYHVKKRDEFTSLIKIIIGQQLSGSIANTIFTRVKHCLKNKITPEVIASIDYKYLSECGVSNSKINYIKGLSRILLDNPKFFIDLRKNNEDEILAQLCKIKGIGIWTASIFTMGTLDHENIFPYGDTSLLKAIDIIYGKEVNLDDVISNWSPYKSFACKILWQWVDLKMPIIK